MLFVKTSIRNSSIHGLGLFADEFIPKGMLVWKYDPILDKRITQGDLRCLPSTSRDFVEKYAFLDDDDTWVLCGDDARFMNHSGSPTCEDRNKCDYAARDIKTGEELTCNYYAFDKSAEDRFGPA